MATLSGGTQLQARLAEMAARLESAKSVSAGVHAGAQYEDGTPVGLVAVTQEFGSSSRGIPPRPYMRPAIKQNNARWGDVIAGALKGGASASTALGVVGEVMQGDIRASIQAVTSPALKPETVRRKGFDKPLIDTELMLRSVDYEVQE